MNGHNIEFGHNEIHWCITGANSLLLFHVVSKNCIASPGIN